MVFSHKKISEWVSTGFEIGILVAEYHILGCLKIKYFSRTSMTSSVPYKHLLLTVYVMLGKIVYKIEFMNK